MKRYTMIASTCLLAAGMAVSAPISGAYAWCNPPHKEITNPEGYKVCVLAGDECRWGGKTIRCTNHLDTISANVDQLKRCIGELKDEYHGMNYTGAGVGVNYATKKAECAQMAQYVKDDIALAYVPGGDTAPRRELNKFIKEMAKEGVYEGDIAKYPPTE